jgi:hypothetical protein
LCRARRLNRREERFGRGNHDFFADAARDEFPGQRVEPTTRPVTRPSRIEMCFRQQPQHRDVILASHRRERWCTERRDRNRAGVVRIVLVRPARPENTYPRRQRRRYVHDTLTRTNELLREETTKPTRGPDRPPSRRERFCPTQQLGELTLPRAHRQLRELMFVAVDRVRRVRRLVRIDPNSHRHDGPFDKMNVEPWQDLLIRVDPARLFRATPRAEHPTADQSFESQPAGDRQLSSRPSGDPRRYGPPRNATTILNQAVMALLGPGTG